MTREESNGSSHCDKAFALAKIAYRNGSTDDISAYVLSLSFKAQGHAVVDADNQVNHAEPSMAPQTPSNGCVPEGPLFRPMSDGTRDEVPNIDLEGTHALARLTKKPT